MKALPHDGAFTCLGISQAQANSKKRKARVSAGFRQTSPQRENLERAKGLEPSTPTLARLRSRLGNRIRSQFGTEKATKFLPLGGEPGALASLQIP